MAQQPMIKRGRGRPPKNPIDGAYGQIKSADPYGDAQQKAATKDFVCQYCGKTYLSNPALYLHIKIKHVQGEGMPMDTLKRGRGRPKKDIYGNYAPAQSNRLDPTGDLFLRTETREGGPIDPMTTFEDNVNLLFRDKFPNGPTSHPMYPYLNQFSFHNTPGGPSETNETEVK